MIDGYENKKKGIIKRKDPFKTLESVISTFLSKNQGIDNIVTSDPVVIFSILCN